MSKSSLVSLLFLSQEALSCGNMRKLLGGASWDYEHMSQWGDDFSMCYTSDQSPIDINTDTVVYDTNVCSNEFEWDLDTSVDTFKVVNNGHSIALIPVETIEWYDEAEEDGGMILSDNTTYRTLTLSDEAIGKFPNNFNPEDSEHEHFCLHSFHFHWGSTSMTGSEHLVDGKQYPLEVHFVHYSCAHASLGLTLDQFGTGDAVNALKEAGEDVHQLGVVGFFFEISEEDNPAFDALFTNARMNRIDTPLAEGTELDELDFVEEFKLSDMIPLDYATAGYYAYEGSLTTPPCTNIVRWHVMNAKAKISEAQMEKFRDLLGADGEHSQAPNFREPQDNVNTVYGCMDAKSTSSDDRSATAVALVWVLFFIAFTAPCCLFCFCYYQSHKERVLTTDNKAAPMVTNAGSHGH